MRRRWFLPEAPDLIGLLGRQLDVTIEGLDAFAAWAEGDPDAALAVRDAEHHADAIKRDLRATLRTAFVTPLEPEDLFALSGGIDRLINQAKDLVREAEVMACPPDRAVAEMAQLVADAARQLARAVARLGDADGDAAEAADAAIKLDRGAEKVYRRAMGELVEVEDLRAVMARRELYRRCSRLGDAVVDVAERVIYAMVKDR
ncbi:DUF47 domain-containing protein [Baekduia soli]|uniref:DUF47 domain-containing protein n=1 Tax=Baekduia soli TaxID=496014 RepID=UPI0016524694|nr:DUF47 family protein [Baekduia soli]